MLPVIFIIITLLSIALFYFGTGRDKRVLPFFFTWLLLVGALAYRGFFEDEDARPPRLLATMIPAVLYTVYFYKKLDTSKIRIHYLLALHGLRLPVELVLHQLYLQGLIPQIMTYDGWNFDILIGITALLLLIYRQFARSDFSDRFYRCWNVAGVLFLANIVIIAILSAPSPVQQLAFGQPNVAILKFPFTFLPAIVVPIVLLGHLLFLKTKIFTK